MTSSKFRVANFARLARFNTDASNHLIEILEGKIRDDIRADSMRPRSCTIAPSMIRCLRKSWFRLRGTEPDNIPAPDLTLNHTAHIGTFLHGYIQKTLQEALGEDWIDVADYLRENPIPYEYVIERSGYECLIQISNPPIKFACDGIIRIDGKIYLLEIKSSDYKSWDDMTNIKAHHMDQIQTYGTILNIDGVLTLYVDRLYGSYKSYEYRISPFDKDRIRSTITYLMESKDSDLAPAKVPDGDYMCLNCEYQKKCKDWG